MWREIDSHKEALRERKIHELISFKKQGHTEPPKEVKKGTIQMRSKNQ
jgi:hypothetical protein